MFLVGGVILVTLSDWKMTQLKSIMRWIFPVTPIASFQNLVVCPCNENYFFINIQCAHVITYFSILIHLFQICSPIINTLIYWRYSYMYGKWTKTDSLSTLKEFCILLSVETFDKEIFLASIWGCHLVLSLCRFLSTMGCTGKKKVLST